MSLRLVTLSVFLCFCSCSESNEKLLPGSSGNINNISVVASNTLWESSVGDLIRENFSRPIYGLPQAEPVFNLNYICLLYTSPSPRDMRRSRMPSSA